MWSLIEQSSLGPRVSLLIALGPVLFCFASRGQILCFVFLSHDFDNEKGTNIQSNHCRNKFFFFMNPFENLK